MVFIIAAEIYAFGAAVYLLLGSGKKQSWADGCTNDSSSVSDLPTFPKTSQDSVSVRNNEGKVNLSTNVVHT